MAQSTANRVYENHDPPHEWAQDEASETLTLMLPGFRRDQMKVQVTSNRILKINGERQMGENKWRRFSKEFPISSDFDTNEISATFAGGLLYVKLPKANYKPQEPTPHEVPKPQQQPKAEVPPTQQKPADKQKAPQEVLTPPKPKEDKAEARVDEISQKSKMEAEANKIAQENEKSPRVLGGEAKASTSKAHEKHETASELGQGEAKIDFTSPTRVLRLSSTQQYKEALLGLIVVVKKQSKFTNFIVAILLVLVLGLYVKNTIKSYSGGVKIQEL